MYHERAPGIHLLARQEPHAFPRVALASDPTSGCLQRAWIRLVYSNPQIAIFKLLPPMQQGSRESSARQWRHLRFSGGTLSLLVGQAAMSSTGYSIGSSVPGPIPPTRSGGPPASPRSPIRRGAGRQPGDRGLTDRPAAPAGDVKRAVLASSALVAGALPRSGRSRPRRPSGVRARPGRAAQTPEWPSA